MRRSCFLIFFVFVTFVIFVILWLEFEVDRIRVLLQVYNKGEWYTIRATIISVHLPERCA